MDITESRKPIDFRIDPAIDRDVGCSSLQRFEAVAFRDKAPVFGVIKVRIMMPGIDLPPNQPSQPATNNDVGRKMLAAGNACNTDSRSSAIRQGLG